MEFRLNGMDKFKTSAVRRVRFFGTKRGKRLIKILLVLIILALSFFIGGSAFAGNKPETDRDIEQELTDSIDEQLGQIDMSPFEEFLQSLGSDEYKLFGEVSFSEKIHSILSGEFANGYDSMFKALFSCMFSGLLNFMPTFASVIVVCVLLGLLSNMKPNFLSKGMGEIIYFVCYSVLIVILFTSIIQIMRLAQDTMNTMKNQMNVVFPVILTLMAGIGSVVSVSVYQPAVAILSNVVLGIITNIVFPLFMITSVLQIVSNLSSGVKLDKLIDALKSFANWLLGISFTVFLAFLSIQGITASVHDGVSIRTAKFAISNTIPLLGGYLKDGFEIIISGSVLIKNAFGVAGLILLLSVVLFPLISIVAFSVGLKLTAGVVEPLTDSRIAGFISGFSKNLSLIIASIIGTTFMYFITIMLLICSANIV